MRSQWKAILGGLLSILLLWWALRDVSFAEVARELRGVDPLLFVLTIAATLSTFWFRAVRWGILLEPVAAGIAFRPRFASTMIGFAANNVLPARVGEFARVLALHRLTQVPVSAALGTLVVERVLDGLVLLALLFAAMAAPGFPPVADAGFDVAAVAGSIAVVVGLVGAGLFLLVLAPERSLRVVQSVAGRALPERFRRPLVSALRAFLEGLLVLRDARLLGLSLFWAVAQWAAGALGYWLAFRAFDVDAGLVAAVFLQSLLSFAVAIPSSPGFFGPFEAATVLALGLWGVSREKAVSMAVGVHLGGFVPVTLMGLYYVWRLGLRWSEVSHSDDAVEAEADGGPSPAAGSSA